MTERKLQDAMAEHSQWQEAAQEMLAEGWDIDVQAEYYGIGLTNRVIRGRLTVDDLRAGVTWANALDGEANAVAGGDINTLGEADHLEAAARRIAHKAGRLALNRVKSERRLQASRADFNRRMNLLGSSSNAGLFQLEAKDLGLH